MTHRQNDVLRLQPHMIPAVRASFASAIDQLDETLVHVRQMAHLPAPWLGDEVSGEVAAHYTARALDAPDSSYAALVAYRDELTRVHDTLARMEDDYRRREGDEAARWGLRA